jgi:hypothetical protein
MSHAQMNKKWEVRMIPPGDGCDGDHLTLWLFFSCVRHLFFCEIVEVLTNRKPAVFFNGEVIG